jgi:hypothetical protein
LRIGSHGVEESRRTGAVLNKRPRRPELLLLMHVLKTDRYFAHKRGDVLTLHAVLCPPMMFTNTSPTNHKLDDWSSPIE